MRFKFRIVFVIIVFLIWWFLSWLELWPKFIFPTPLMVFKSLYIGFFEDGNVLVWALLRSLERAFIGFSISLIIGLLLGMLTVHNVLFEEILRMISLGVQSIPSICWVPLAILWFGLSEGAILFVIIMGSCFSISMSTYSGIKNISPININVSKNLGAHGIKLISYVIMPAIMPSLIIGIKQGWAFAWRALMAVEMLSSSMGLGHSLVMARDLADISRIFSIIIIIAGIGYFIEKIIFIKIEYNIKMKRGLINSN